MRIDTCMDMCMEMVVVMCGGRLGREWVSRLRVGASIDMCMDMCMVTCLTYLGGGLLHDESVAEATRIQMYKLACGHVCK